MFGSVSDNEVILESYENGLSGLVCEQSGKGFLILHAGSDSV